MPGRVVLYNGHKTVVIVLLDASIGKLTSTEQRQFVDKSLRSSGLMSGMALVSMVPSLRKNCAPVMPQHLTEVYLESSC